MACTQMYRCDAHPESCDNVDPMFHDSDVEDDDSETVHHFRYYNDSPDNILASSCGVIEDDEVDNIVDL